MNISKAQFVLFALLVTAHHHELIAQIPSNPTPGQAPTVSPPPTTGSPPGPSVAPVPPTVAPVPPTVAPVPPTVAPVPPTVGSNQAPQSPTSSYPSTGTSADGNSDDAKQLLQQIDELEQACGNLQMSCVENNDPGNTLTILEKIFIQTLQNICVTIKQNKIALSSSLQCNSVPSTSSLTGSSPACSLTGSGPASSSSPSSISSTPSLASTDPTTPTTLPSPTPP